MIKKLDGIGIYSCKINEIIEEVNKVSGGAPETTGILGNKGLDRRSGGERRGEDRRSDRYQDLSDFYRRTMNRRSGKDRRQGPAEVSLRDRVATCLALNGVPEYYKIADALIKELKCNLNQ